MDFAVSAPFPLKSGLVFLKSGLVLLKSGKSILVDPRSKIQDDTRFLERSRKLKWKQVHRWLTGVGGTWRTASPSNALNAKLRSARYQYWHKNQDLWSATGALIGCSHAGKGWDSKVIIGLELEAPCYSMPTEKICEVYRCPQPVEGDVLTCFEKAQLWPTSGPPKPSKMWCARMFSQSLRLCKADAHAQLWPTSGPPKPSKRWCTHMPSQSLRLRKADTVHVRNITAEVQNQVNLFVHINRSSNIQCSHGSFHFAPGQSCVVSSRFRPCDFIHGSVLSRALALPKWLVHSHRRRLCIWGKR